MIRFGPVLIVDDGFSSICTDGSSFLRKRLTKLTLDLLPRTNAQYLLRKALRVTHLSQQIQSTSSRVPVFNAIWELHRDSGTSTRSTLNFFNSGGGGETSSTFPLRLWLNLHCRSTAATCLFHDPYYVTSASSQVCYSHLLSLSHTLLVLYTNLLLDNW